MTSPNRFDHVSVEKIANVYYEGRTFSRTVWFEDGRKKMLGIVLPCDADVPAYEFKTDSSERIEILAGECEVKLAGEEEFSYYRAGQAFLVEGHSSYELRNEAVVQYICHLEGWRIIYKARGKANIKLKKRVINHGKTELFLWHSCRAIHLATPRYRWVDTLYSRR